MTLIYILVAYLVLALCDAAMVDIADSFVELLGQWGMLVMSFYFGGRTLEKIIDMRSKNK
jgi:small neutral amino acid transporter SnatA (MarC family)